MTGLLVTQTVLLVMILLGVFSISGQLSQNRERKSALDSSFRGGVN